MAEATRTTETIAENVRERLHELTPSERRVARTLLATYPTAGLQSMPQLAQGAGVTGPTVLRFVRKVGFAGYPDFQRSLRAEVQARTEGLPTLYRTRGTPPRDEMIRSFHGTFTRALDATFTSSTLDDDLDAVVGLLCDPRRRLWFVGGRFSQLVARYLEAQLRMLRPGCGLVDESPDRRILDAMEIGRRDALCLFDYRRYQQDTIAVGRVAAERGAEVVVFTDPWLSPSVESASHVLISHVDSPSPFDSLVAAFAVTELITARVVEALGEAGSERVSELEGVHARVDGDVYVARAGGGV
jgi:DNA-binding MurR/RpiR family transcriptional regulator